MFEEFDVSLKKASSVKKEGGGSKGKAKAGVDSNTSSAQMPWSTLLYFLEEEGIQLCAWPFGVDPPCNITKQGIKSLSATAARQLLSALKGETEDKPFLRRTDAAVFSKDKFPVILTTAPPSNSKKTNGDVVLNDANLTRNCQKYGLPRRASAATGVKGKAKPGRASNPIAVLSTSPLDCASQLCSKLKSKKIVVSEDEDNNNNNTNDNDVTIINRPLHQQGDVSAQSPYLKPIPRPPQASAISTTPRDREDNDWEETVRRLKKQKVPRTVAGKTMAEVMDGQRARAQEIIAHATSTERMSTSRCTTLPPKPIVFINSMPTRSTARASSTVPTIPSPSAPKTTGAPPPATKDVTITLSPLTPPIDGNTIFPPLPATASSNAPTSMDKLGDASRAPTAASPTIANDKTVATPPPSATLPVAGVTAIPSLNQLKRNASAVDNQDDTSATTKKPRYTPKPSPATNISIVDVDQPAVLPPYPLDAPVPPTIKTEAGGSTMDMPPPARHHMRPSPTPELHRPPPPHWSWYPPPPSQPPPPWENSGPYYQNYGYYPPPPPGAYHYRQQSHLESSQTAPPGVQESRPPVGLYPPYYPPHGPYSDYGPGYGAPQPQYPPYGPPPGQWQAPPAPSGAPRGEQGASRGSSHAPGGDE
ncbi:hypothetical protein C0991_012294 [Blastosporella zonata]|nr:hypothetical protein C0991_012294 [Blastosporella zonata]